MNKELKTKLHGVIEDEIERLNGLEDGSEERVTVIENINKLYRLEIEDNKIEYESTDKYRNSEIAEEDMNFKKRDARMKFIMDGIKVGAEISVVILNLIALKHHLKDMYKFEETGTLCSEAGKKTFNLVPKLFKTK